MLMPIMRDQYRSLRSRTDRATLYAFDSQDGFITFLEEDAENVHRVFGDKAKLDLALGYTSVRLPSGFYEANSHKLAEKGYIVRKIEQPFIVANDKTN